MEITDNLQIKNVCCQGYGWRVILIVGDCLGICDNPECPQKCGCNDPSCVYDGMSFRCEEDLIAGLDEGVFEVVT